jgi:starch synthase (maltosyl-transferring)
MMIDIKNIDGRKRIVIENIKPQIDNGQFPIKRVIGETVSVTADIFADGHDVISAALLYRHESSQDWQQVPMKFIVNDEWTASFQVTQTGYFYYTICGWLDYFATWCKDIEKKYNAGQDVSIDLKIGIKLLEKKSMQADEATAQKIRHLIDVLNDPKDIKIVIEEVLRPEIKKMINVYADKSSMTQYPAEFSVHVNRPKALFSTWYEFFPRSFGNFKDCEKYLPEIQKMGFDVVYLPPIHPIGETKRKGKNNSIFCRPDDPGSPWAIGSSLGGHKAIEPKLGTLDDFKHFIESVKELDMEVAIDLAFQCSPDHPYVKEHPQWFKWRPDNTVQFAENPPKKYEDILPLNFETDDWHNLWIELKSIVIFWIQQGIGIFRVDNPHTKPFTFWQWLLAEIKKEYPEIIFLSEAFTRPKLMQRLAKIGFDQSYTYFTWRNTKYEIEQYLTELTQTEIAEYMRSNFWPNTPDILPQYLQFSSRAAFIIRLILAATLSSNYGIYGPAYELCVSQAIEDKEEYLNAEKYELKKWDTNQKGNIKSLIERINRCRNENPALQSTRNVHFLNIHNDMIIAFFKTTEDLSNIIVTTINIDPYHKQAGTINLPLEKFGMDETNLYMLNDLLSNDKYIRQGRRIYIELDPNIMPAHIFKLHKLLKHENDFDYFM